MSRIFTFFTLVVASLLMFSCEEDADVTGAIYPTSVEIADEGDVNTYLESGDVVELSLLISPKTATEVAAVWSSSNEDSATVSDSGVVTAGLTAGEATITALIKDESGADLAASILFRVKAPTSPSTIAISGDLYLVLSEDGEVSTLLTASVRPTSVEDGSVKWDVEDDTILEIDEDGLVTAKSAGTTTITATSNADSSIFEEVEFTVYPVPVYATSIEFVTLSSATITPDVDEAYKLVLELTYTNSDGDTVNQKDVTYTTNNDDVTVSTAGVVTAVFGAKGTVTITASVKTDGEPVTTSITLTINDAPTADSITLAVEDSRTSLDEKEIIVVSATVVPTGDYVSQEVVWTSSSNAVATVDEGGNVTGVGTGSVTITATTLNALNSGGSAKVSNSVTLEVNNVVAAGDFIYLATGATISPAEWTSSYGKPDGLIFSLSNSVAKFFYLDIIKTAQWATSGYEHLVGSNGLSTTNTSGLDNMAIVKAANTTLDPDSTTAFEHYPAFILIHALNDDDVVYSSANPYGVWYMPIGSELTTLRSWLQTNTVTTVNGWISAVGGTGAFPALADSSCKRYWSSYDGNNLTGTTTYRTAYIGFKTTTVESNWQNKTGSNYVVAMAEYLFDTVDAD